MATLPLLRWDSPTRRRPSDVALYLCDQATTLYCAAGEFDAEAFYNQYGMTQALYDANGNAVRIPATLGDRQRPSTASALPRRTPWVSDRQPKIQAAATYCLRGMWLMRQGGWHQA